MRSTIVAPRAREAHVQRAQEPQRVDVAVGWAEARAGDLRADLRQHLCDRGAVEHRILEGRHAGLVVQALERIGAALDLALGEEEMQPAGPPIAHVEPGLLGKRCRKRGPSLRGRHGPQRVLGHAGALALHPHQREVSARGAPCDVALVEHDHAAAAPRQPPGHRHADEPAAHHGEVIFGGRFDNHACHAGPLPQRLADYIL